MSLSKVFIVLVAVTAIAVKSARPGAQGRVIPRPPAPPPGANNADAGSAAPDGYAPIPQWAGQTRAPHPARSEPFSVETVATGLSGAFSFHFLPDGSIGGRILRLVPKD